MCRDLYFSSLSLSLSFSLRTTSLVTPRSMFLFPMQLLAACSRLNGPKGIMKSESEFLKLSTVIYSVPGLSCQLGLPQSPSRRKFLRPVKVKSFIMPVEGNADSHEKTLDWTIGTLMQIHLFTDRHMNSNKTHMEVTIHMIGVLPEAGDNNCLDQTNCGNVYLMYSYSK